MRVPAGITHGCTAGVVALALSVGAPIEPADGREPVPAAGDSNTTDERPATAHQIVFLNELGLRVEVRGRVIGDGRVAAERWLDARPAVAEAAQAEGASTAGQLACGANLRIGMVDTSVNRAHPDLRTQSIVQRSFGTPQLERSSWTHGTAVAGLLVGQNRGLLPQADLFVAAALHERTDGSLRLDLLGFMRALDWLAGNGVSVVNLSFETAENPVLSLVLARAAERGLVLLAAAGNGGVRARPAYPAAHPDVIAVTAVDRRQQIYRHANRGGYIDFAAPGVNVMTPGPYGLRRQSGTSVAVPFVVAAAARLVETGIPAHPDTIRSALIEQAEDLGPPGLDPTFGWGYVDPRIACG